MSGHMEAPMYPAAIGFEPPLINSYVPRLEDVSLAELMSRPAAWSIVLKHLPWLRVFVASPGLRPQLGNMTVQSLATFTKALSPAALAAVDEELARLALLDDPAP